MKQKTTKNLVQIRKEWPSCIYVFSPKTKYECIKAGLLAQSITFYLPIKSRQWYIKMLLQTLQLREQPPVLTGFPFNSFGKETLSGAKVSHFVPPIKIFLLQVV